MAEKSLTEYCFETLSKEVTLTRVAGLEDVEKINLLNGDDGGGIKVHRGEDAVERVTCTNLKFGDGVPIPHFDNALALGAEVFQIRPDFSYKLPTWGINSIIMKDGGYYFDTDFIFGFDLVMDYDFTMKYLGPFDDVFKKYLRHKDFQQTPRDKMTLWIRTYLSPVFIMVDTRVEHQDVVHELCAELIQCWMRMCRDAEKQDEAFKQSQLKRVMSQYAGMQQTDRMGKLMMDVYGQENFGKFMKAMM